MPLTDSEIEGFEPREQSYKRSDGHALYIFIRPNGSKLWRMNYRFEGKQKTLSFGAWPIVTLEEARALRNNAKRLLRQDIDPGAVQQSRKARRRGRAPTTFDVIADEFLEKRRLEGLAETTLSKKAWLLDFAREEMGVMPIAEIKPRDVLAVLRAIEAKGNYESAKRLRTTIGEVFRYAVATLRAETDPTPVLRGALISPKVRHMPAIVDAPRFARLIRAIWNYEGRGNTASALKLMALLFPRPGELRKATWSEIDFNTSTWTIPAERMKMRREHKKPLPPAALHILLDLRGTSAATDLVFPATTSPDRPMSENTMNLALQRLGFAGDELAHVDTKSARSIYNRAKYWSERVEMMTWWSEHVVRNTNAR